MADLRKAFDQICRKWGHDVFLQRRDWKKQELGPWGQADNQGFSTQLERWTVRHKYPSARGLSLVMDEKEEGIEHTVNFIYYFRWDAAPKEGDRIYEKEDRYKDRQIFPGFATYIVTYAVPMYGKGGELVFWQTGAIRESPR